jgi:hypothetical protein
MPQVHLIKRCEKERGFQTEPLNPFRNGGMVHATVGRLWTGADAICLLRVSQSQVCSVTTASCTQLADGIERRNP